jgi:hypothetical protein
MSAPEAPSRLRIAVIGLSGEEVDWTAQLAGEDVEVVVVHDVRDLRSAGAGLGVVFASAETVAQILPALTEGSAPPLALFVDRREGPDRRNGKSYGGKREIRDRRRARVPGTFPKTDAPD